MTRPTLGILAAFKDEADVLDEWLRHYEGQGVERFYLIDNGSRDARQAEAILAAHGGITCITDPRRHAQTLLYNDALHHVVRSDPRAPERTCS